MSADRRSGEPLRLAIADFWPSFDPRQNFLRTTLEHRFVVEFDDSAEILVFGPFGRRHVGSRATKVFCSGEPFARPSRLGFDYSLSWHLWDDERHLRLPPGLWGPLAFPAAAAALPARSFDEWSARPFFCNFVYSNEGPAERKAFFAALSRRRFVHAPGTVENNCEPLPGGRFAPDWWLRKLEYLRQFRFTVAFESASLPGYTSEKAVDALLTGTVPIYWGNPEVALDLDPASLVEARRFHSLEALADHIVELDDNRELARPLFAHPHPVMHDLEQSRDAVIALFDEARRQRSLGGHVRRLVRPWLYSLAAARRKVGRRGT